MFFKDATTKFIQNQFVEQIEETFEQIVAYQDSLVKKEVKADPTPITREFPDLTDKVVKSI